MTISRQTFQASTGMQLMRIYLMRLEVSAIAICCYVALWDETEPVAVLFWIAR